MLQSLGRRDKNSRLDPETNDGAYIEDSLQGSLAKKRSQRELSRAWTTATWSTVLNLVLGGALVFTALGWRKAEDRYADNVQVAWVKLLPNGQSQVEYFADGGQGNRFFEATVNASLINYTEHRYRRRKETIEADYGYALQFMSDNLRDDFLGRFNAAKVAADLSTCSSCDLADIEVRAIDHNTLITPERINANTGVFESTVYIREITLGRGTANSVRNRQVKLTWALRPVSQIARNLTTLKDNPLGMQILSERTIDDLAQGNN